jgi:uncharacterized protein YbjT (DUF2867 family)
VQADWFFQNFSEGLLLEGVRSGEFVFPAGEVKVPFIDTRDLADVVVKALTDSSYAGRIREISGARLLSFREAMAEISAAAATPAMAPRLMKTTENPAMKTREWSRTVSRTLALGWASLSWPKERPVM